MNTKFDELAKGLAQSVTRRQALKRFGVGLAGMALACFGLANRAEAAPSDCGRLQAGGSPELRRIMQCPESSIDKTVASNCQ